MLEPASLSCFGVDPASGDPLYAAIRMGVNSTIQRIVLIPSRPIFNFITHSGSNLVLSGTNGTPNASYLVLSNSMASVPAGWTVLSTNAFDGSGNFIFTNPFNPVVPQSFYILRLP